MGPWNPGKFINLTKSSRLIVRLLIHKSLWCNKDKNSKHAPLRLKYVSRSIVVQFKQRRNTNLKPFLKKETTTVNMSS